MPRLQRLVRLTPYLGIRDSGLAAKIYLRFATQYAPHHGDDLSARLKRFHRCRTVRFVEREIREHGSKTTR